MKVEILEEAGFDSALYGFSLSYRKPGFTREEWWTEERRERTRAAALANASKDKGHNKFLEHMQIWLSVTANFEWWKQFDTYRIGVSKQSSSTMHTLDATEIKEDYFDIAGTEFATPSDLSVYRGYLAMLNRQSTRLKSKALPQAFLQEREVVLSYKVIRHINAQRFAHRLPDWISFLEQVKAGLIRSEFLGEVK